MSIVKSYSLGRVAGAKVGIITASWAWQEPQWQIGMAERYTRITDLLNASSTSHVAVIYESSYTSLRLASVKVVFGAASSSGTLMIQKLTGTQAPGGGSNSLASTISLSGSINTVVTGTINNDLTRKLFADGDRFAVVLGGTLTGLSNCLLSLGVCSDVEAYTHCVYVAPRRCRVMRILLAADMWRISEGGTVRLGRVVNNSNPGPTLQAFGPTVDIAFDITTDYANHEYLLVPSASNNYCILEAGDRIFIDFNSAVRPIGLNATVELLPIPDELHWLST